VYAQNYLHFEIIVVDNGSHDGTVAAIQQQYPDVRIIALDQNIGACAGRNRGMVEAKGDIIFSLDSDASLVGDTISVIIDRFQQDASLGIITTKVINYKSRAIDPNAWLFTEIDKEEQDQEFWSYSFSEGASAIRTEVVKRVGVFWEFLFWGREGEDLCIRAWDAGYKTLYFPRAMVLHRVSEMGGAHRKKELYYEFRNQLYLYLAYYPWWSLPRALFTKTAVSVVKGIRRGTIGGVLSALHDVIKHLPYVLRYRKPISDKTARLYFHVQRQHGPRRWTLLSWLKYKA
jgi:hypothetical protein